MSTRLPTREPKGRTVWLIELDNGEDYEDHRRDPEFAVPTKARAEAIVAEVTEWVKKHREELAEGENRQAYLDRLKAPYGLKGMLAALDDFSGHYSHLVITPITLAIA